MTDGGGFSASPRRQRTFAAMLVLGHADLADYARLLVQLVEAGEPCRRVGARRLSAGRFGADSVAAHHKTSSNEGHDRWKRYP
jgi:hypothetical protein